MMKNMTEKPPKSLAACRLEQDNYKTLVDKGLCKNL